MPVVRIGDRLYLVADNPKRRPHRKGKRKHKHSQLRHHAKEAARETVSGAMAMIVGVALITLILGSNTKA